MQYYGKDYIEALRTNYPSMLEGEEGVPVDQALHIGIVDSWIRELDAIGVDPADRFQPIEERPWTYANNAWTVSGGDRNVRRAAVYASYKGLINLKPAIDLALYSNLIWQLQPRTILEFGSLQGGSALWFADQLDTQCGFGEIHSFELCYKCIHERASHPRLRFHEVDLRDLSTLDADLLAGLPHPWLVVEDSHENLENLIPYLASFMVKGDYLVIEDVLLRPTAAIIEKAVGAVSQLGFLVDTNYTDAFGTNVTCAPNGWLVKQ